MNTTDTHPITSDGSDPSPVSWQTLLWILLGLAINSISQPSSNSKLLSLRSRYRLYFSSSPILCVVDSIALLIRLLATVFHTRRKSFKFALQLVRLSRSDFSISSTSARLGQAERNADEDEENEEKEKPPEAQPWPRYILFILGVLPLAIKLASFSGTPWTKIWGMMFLSSFLTNELFSVLCRFSAPKEKGRSTIEELFGVSEIDSDNAVNPIEGDSPTNTISMPKYHKLSRTLSKIEAILFALSILAHLALLRWELRTLWSPVNQKIHDSASAHNVLQLFKTALYFLLWLVSSIWLIFFDFLGVDREGSVGRFTYKILILLLMAVAAAVFDFLPKTTKGGANIPPPPPELGGIRPSPIYMIYIYVFVVLYAINSALKRICWRWPMIAKFLLLEKREEKSKESPNGQNTEDEAGERTVKAGSTDKIALMGFYFFLVNLVVTVLWYAYIYDEIGTVNPSWTGVFG